MQETQIQSLVSKFSWRRKRQPTSVFFFPLIFMVHWEDPEGLGGQGGGRGDQDGEYM